MTLLTLLLLLTLSVHVTAEPLLHIPLSRRAIPASRAFTLTRRPWAAHLASRRPADALSPQHLSRPLRLAANGSALPSHPMFGDIITLGEYFVSLTFGGQPINVQVDTGSSTIAVPLRQCVNCRKGDHRLDLRRARGTAGFIACASPACRRGTCGVVPSCTVCSARSRACCAAVAPDACGFFLRYADNSGASGALVQADVGIAGLTVPLAFGAILRETAEFENENVDGIFGLAYESLACNPTCVAPLFDTLVHSGKVKRDVFSLCTARNGGMLSLGGSKPDLYEGDLQYVPMKHKGTPHFYDVLVKGVHIGGVKVNVPDFSDAIVDSGTTVLVIAPRSYDALRAYFQANYCHVPGLCPTKHSARELNATGHLIERSQLKGADAGTLDAVEKAAGVEDGSWFSPGYCVRLDQKEVDMLPDIVIGLEDGVKLTLEPNTYMLEYEASSTFAWDKVIYRCLGIAFLQGLEHMENNAILGNTVLQKYFVEYDRENERVGFAVAKNCVDPDAKMLAPSDFLSSVESPSLLPKWLLLTLAGASVAAWVFAVIWCARESRKFNGYTPIPEDTR